MECTIISTNSTSHSNSFNSIMPDRFYLNGIAVSLLAVWGIVTIIPIMLVYYADKTGGRNFLRDRRQYDRSYGELIRYYKDADPYKMRESDLPLLDWKKSEGIIFGKVGNRLIKRSAYENGGDGVNIALRPFSFGSMAELLRDHIDALSPATLDEGCDIYIEIPQDKIKVYSPISTILIQNFMTAFMQRPDRSAGIRRMPVLFVLDEFPQLRFEFDTLSAALSTLRSKSVSVMIAQQSIAQLINRYSEDCCREIIDTCSYLSIMSAQDPKSRQFFQELIGTKKI